MRKHWKTLTIPIIVVLMIALWCPLVAQAQGCTHVVQPGETLTSIAQRYGTNVWAIAQANGLTNLNYIRVGQRLSIPSCGYPGGAVHVVQHGDTLTNIARRYGTTVGAIMQANGLWNPNYIWVGQRLRIPSGGYPGGRVYVVQRGDTLTGIARWYGTTIWAIMGANGLTNPNYIWVGQQLYIP